MTMENSSPNSAAPQNITYFSDGNVLRDIGKLEGRIDGHDKDIERLNKFGEDITKLKEWRSYLMGGAAILSIIIPLVMKHFGWI